MKSPALPSSRGERLLLLTYAGLTLYFTAPLLATGNQLGVEDWDILLFYHASVFKSGAGSASSHSGIRGFAPATCSGRTRRSRCSARCICSR